MPTASKKTNKADQVAEALDWLKRNSSKAYRDGMKRFAIPNDRALGVAMGDIQKLAKLLGRSHALAAALWKTDVYEARLLASFVDEPDAVTPTQMDRWCRDFDNWAICDTVCFHLFDRTPHAWNKVKQWSTLTNEFEKRAAFATLWGLTVHDKTAADKLFLQALPLIESAASDERNFVKKAVNMSLRAMGKRNLALHAAAKTVAQRLADSSNPAARWVGKDALRELMSASVLKRVAAKG